MDAMKDALKRKMQDAKVGAGAKSPMSMGDDPQELAVKSGEIAPGLDSEGPGEAMGDPGEMAEPGEQDDASLLDAAQQAVGPDVMQKILMAIADSGTPGRAGNSLGERAAVGARAKLDSMK